MAAAKYWDGSQWVTLAGPAGPPGPTGPTGPTGPAGGLTGAAGGDLQGTYPNALYRRVGGVIKGTLGGGVAGGGPPNSTSGAAFNIPAPGWYVMSFETDLWRTAPGAFTLYSYIDGAQVASDVYYMNIANQHMPGWRNGWAINLAAGTHYHWVAAPGMSADSNSTWYLDWSPG